MSQRKLALLDRLVWSAVIGMSLVPLLPYGLMG
jgi:hypothetical protein